VTTSSSRAVRAGLALVVLLAMTGCSGAGDDPAMRPTPGTAGGTQSPTPQGWFAVAPALLQLTEVAAASFGGELWVVGGLDTRGQAARDVQVYDPDMDTWEPGPELLDPLHHTALVAAPDGLLLIGGYRGPGFDAPSAQVWRLDSATGDWQEAPPLPEPRAAGAAAWDGEQIVYAGGVGSDLRVRDDVFALRGDVWTRVAALRAPREHLGAASDGNGRVWFLGGRRGDLSTNTGVVDILRDGQITHGPSLPTPRGGAAAFWSSETGACLIGGEAASGTFSTVECVDAAGEVRTLPAMAQPRHGLGVAVVDGIAYAALGGPTPGLSSTAIVEALALEALASD